jgi:hypothetical protein
VYRSDQFIQLQLHSRTVSVLSVLDEEYHEESDDSRARVYDQLPGVTEAEYGAGKSPYQDDEGRTNKSSWVPCSLGGQLSQAGEWGVMVHGLTPLIRDT